MYFIFLVLYVFFMLTRLVYVVIRKILKNNIYCFYEVVILLKFRVFKWVDNKYFLRKFFNFVRYIFKLFRVFFLFNSVGVF